MSRAPGTRCADCGIETLSPEPGVPTEYYMVRDDIWEAAGMPVSPDLTTGTDLAAWQATRGKFLCIGCLEARLGRQLHRGDFSDAKLNDLNYDRPDKAWWHRTERLRDRLTAPSPHDGVQLTLWDR